MRIEAARRTESANLLVRGFLGRPGGLPGCAKCAMEKSWAGFANHQVQPVTFCHPGKVSFHLGAEAMILHTDSHPSGAEKVTGGTAWIDLIEQTLRAQVMTHTGPPLNAPHLAFGQRAADPATTLSGKEQEECRGRRNALRGSPPALALTS